MKLTRRSWLLDAFLKSCRHEYHSFSTTEIVVTGISEGLKNVRRHGVSTRSASDRFYRFAI